MRIAKTILRWIFSAFVLMICGILLFRMFASGDPSSLAVLTVNDRLARAYAEHGEDMTLYTQGQLTLTSATYKGKAGVDHKFLNKNNNGYFGVTQSVIIEEAKQVQLVFRYNNSTIKHLKEDYQLSEMPARSEELYDVTLLLAVDLTPEDDSDNLSHVLDPASVALIRVHADKSVTFREEKNLYNYYKLVYDLPEDLNMDHILAIYADVYYMGDIVYLEENFDVYKAEPYGTLCIYEYISKKVPYELTKDDLAALEGEKP